MPIRQRGETRKTAEENGEKGAEVSEAVEEQRRGIRKKRTNTRVKISTDIPSAYLKREEPVMSFKFVPLSVYFNRVSLRFSAAKALRSVRRETRGEKVKGKNERRWEGKKEKKRIKGTEGVVRRKQRKKEVERGARVRAARTRGSGSQWLTR